MSQSLDFAPINLRDVGVDVRHVSRGRSEPGADRILLRFQLQQMIDKRACAFAFFRQLDDPLDRFEDFLQVGSISTF
ncbi:MULTISPECIES: hypothetical protein [Sphingobium]|uniref:hypothetical protein n=1 Tax=Sphingobium TaxID=165695 RepID=UPI001E425956|nr:MULTISPECIES: hypothetical protein [Sphingobium]